LLYVGWLYDFSGLREVALELARRRTRFPNVKCLVVGDGELLQELQWIRTELGMTLGTGSTSERGVML
jgi:hypothetical protein